MQPRPALQAALDRCYAVFAHYPFPRTWEFSPYKDGDRMLRDLGSAPLRDLSGEQIGPYAGSAILTVGGIDDYKHFLPRILEQAVRDPVWLGTDPAVIGRRLVRAEWRCWPDDERDAVLSLFREGFSQAVQEHPEHSYPDAKEWFWGLLALGENAAGALREWTAVPSADAALQFARMVGDARQLFRDSGTRDLSADARRDVRNWLLGEVPQAFLVEAATTVDVAEQWQIEAAFDDLDQLRVEYLS